MTPFAVLVHTSQRVAATSARLAKVSELASLLRILQSDEVETAVLYLAGAIPQGRIGLRGSTLRTAASHTSATAPMLSIGEVDRRVGVIAAMHGDGSAARRAQALQDLCSKLTPDEQEFLLRLLAGVLRQGALEGVMIEAVAAAASVPVERERTAAMYDKS